MPRNKRRRRKSAKRVARGKKLARTLPRDRKGKFLPAGSKNLFRRTKTKKRRRRSVPAKRRPSQKKQVKRAKLTRRKSLPAMSRRGSRAKTKDDFPNFMSGFIEQDLINGFKDVVVNTPIPRLKTIGNKATVMELLYMDVVHSGWSWVVFNSAAFFQMIIGTGATNILSWSDTRNIVDFRWAKSDGVSNGVIFSEFGAPFRYQFQTLDGFGYLLAADSFRVVINSQFQAGVGRVDFKLYYRFVDIPLSEFIGIVQSTQAQG